MLDLDNAVKINAVVINIYYTVVVIVLALGARRFLAIHKQYNQED